MKVKVGELKTHLSKYLRQIDQGGEPIEVCVREETVAYLTPAKHTHTQANQADRIDTEQQLQSAGIRVSQWPAETSPDLGAYGSCEQPAGGRNSIESIRGERGW